MYNPYNTTVTETNYNPYKIDNTSNTGYNVRTNYVNNING